MELTVYSDDFNTRYKYEVTYNVAHLKDLLVELACYGYLAYGAETYETKGKSFRITEKAVQRKAMRAFKKYDKNNYDYDYNMIQETSLYKTDGKNARYTYAYSYTKLPDLYHYVALLVDEMPTNWDEKISGYIKLLEKDGITTSIPNLGSQLIWKIFEYGNSEEFQKLASERDYDYKGLCELYTKVLKNIKLQLVRVTKIDTDSKIEDGETFVKKRLKEKGK